MQGADDACAAPADLLLEPGGLQVFLDVDESKTFGSELMEKPGAVGLRSLESPPVPLPPHGEYHGKPGAPGQPSCRELLRVEKVVDPQLGEVHPPPPCLEVMQVSVERLFGEDEADLPAFAQKSLLYT